jgi:hypothetical protein
LAIRLGGGGAVAACEEPCSKTWCFFVDIEEAIANAIDVEEDDDGKPLYIARIRGVSVRIVLALDEPDFVVTIHERGDDAN